MIGVANETVPNVGDPSVVVISGMTLRQANPPTLSSAHSVSNPVVDPSSLLGPGPLRETVVTANIHELLFEVIRDGTTFWVGVAVPANPVDFRRAQVFFHPTVINGGVVLII